MECYNCSKKGHIAKFCRSKSKKKDNGAAAGTAHSFPITTKTLLTNKEENLWLSNTGASVHVAYDKSIFRNYTKSAIKHIRGAGLAEVSRKGDINIVATVGNKTFDLMLKDVLHVPSMKFNLISLGQMEKAGLSFMLRNGQMDGIK
jgi:hypothetical protein